MGLIEELVNSVAKQGLDILGAFLDQKAAENQAKFVSE